MLKLRGNYITHLTDPKINGCPISRLIRFRSPSYLVSFCILFLYSLLDLVRYPHYFIDMKNKQDVLRHRQVAEFGQINNEG